MKLFVFLLPATVCSLYFLTVFGIYGIFSDFANDGQPNIWSPFWTVMFLLVAILPITTCCALFVFRLRRRALRGFAKTTVLAVSTLSCAVGMYSTVVDFGDAMIAGIPLIGFGLALWAALYTYPDFEAPLA